MANPVATFFRWVGTKIAEAWAAAETLERINMVLSVVTLAVGVKGFMQARQMLAKGQDILANKTSAGGKIPVIYGTRRVGAQVVYMDVSNNDSRHLFVVYALSVGEVDEILGRTIQLDGNPLTDSARFRYGCYVGSDNDSSLNTVSQVGSTISAGAGGFGTSSTSRYRITLNLHHGAATQTADPMLVASMPNWTSAHKLNGIAYIAAHYKYDKEGMFAGVPQLTVQVRGKKVYDPRDSGQIFGTVSTYEYSSNPALCFLDFITNNEYGKGLTQSQINMSTFSSAANVCDTEVDNPFFGGVSKSLTWSGNSGDGFITIGGSDPNNDWWQNKIGELIDIYDNNGDGVITGKEITDIQRDEFYDQNPLYRVYFNDTLGTNYSTQSTGSSLAKIKRFHCNGYLDTNKNVMDNAKELLANMRGIFLYIDGKYELQIEDTGTSTFTITDDHIISDAGISVDYGNKDKKANKVIVEFFNANKRYELDTATAFHDATPEYYSDDNDEILEIKAEFPYVTDPYIAYNMAKAILVRSRKQMTIQFLGTPEMYKLNVGDIVTLNYVGTFDTSQTCRVEALELQPNGLVAVSLIEYFDVYTWQSPPEEPLEELANLPSAYAVKAPTNITFTDSSSSSTGRPILSWDAPTDYPDYEFRVNVVDDSGNQLMNRIVNTTFAELNFTPTGSNYVASITSLNTLGTESDPETETFSVSDEPVGLGDIRADAVTANTIDVNELSAISADMGSITAGSIDIGSGNFTVSSAGVMTATGATISGNLTATSLNVTDATVTGTLDASVITLNSEPLDNVLTYSESGGIGLLTLNEGAAIDGDFVVAGNFEATGLEPDLIVGKVTGISSDTTQADAILRSQSGSGSFKIQAGQSNTTVVSLAYDALGGTTLLGDTGAGGSTGKVRINVDGSLGMEFNESRNATFADEVKANALELPSNTPSTTTNKLYNSSGTLYFNGSALGTGSGDITGVTITTTGGSLTGGASYSSGDATFTLDIGSTITGAKTFDNNVVIQGDLDVQGTTTTINTTNLDVKDKNITLNYGTGDTSANANGAGITIQDAVNSTTDATLTWNTSDDSFNFSHDVNVTGAITAQSSTGGFFYAEDTTTGVVNNELIGGFLFKSNDTSGTQPHYAGMTARAVSTFGSMALEFFADRADYESDTPALSLYADTTDSSTNTLNFQSSTAITGVTSISSGAITSTGDISGATIEGYTFPSFPSVSGYILKSDTSGNLSWTANAISSYVDSGDDRVVTSTGSTGIQGEYGLTYNRTDGLKLQNYNGTGGLTSTATLTLGQSTNNSGISNLILDSQSQGSIQFKDGTTVDASISYNGAIGNILSITCGNGITFGSSNLTTTGTISSEQINATTTADATPAIIATNTGGLNATIQRWVGDADGMELRNYSSSGDYVFVNNEQDNGFLIFDGTGGVDILYNGSTVQSWDSFGGTDLVSGDFKVGGTTVIQSSGNNLVNIGVVTASGLISTDSHVQSGDGSGGVALTINDGYGNANITWNHLGGVPEQNGNAARIEVNTDATSAATMYFELKSGVTSGVAVQTDTIMLIDDTGLEIASGKTIRGNGQLTLTANDMDFSVADITDTVQNFIFRDYSASKLYLGTADAVATLRSALDLNSNNITNAGNISSGAITSTGLTVATASGAVINLEDTGSHTWKLTTDNQDNFFKVKDGTSTTYFKVGTADSEFATNLNLTSGHDFKINGTTVIDSSRNLTNIGTISSGAITSTGTSEFASLNLGGVTSTGSSFLSGTQRIVGDGYIATQAIYNYGETGSAPAAIVFGNGSTYGNDQISLITSGVTALYIDSAGDVDISGDLTAGTIEGYTFPSYPSQSGGVLTSDVSGNMAWSFNTISSYVDSGDDRVVTSTGSTGIQGEYGLTYNRTDGLKLQNYDGTGGLTSSATLTLGQSTNNSGISQLILDSQSQGSIRFKDGTTTDASITYEGVFSNKLSISCGNGVTFGSSNLETTGTISSGAITSSGASTFSSNVNIDRELRLDARADGGSGDNVLAFKDSGGDYTIRHNVNDGNGNYSISIGYSGVGNGRYEVTGDGVGKLLFGGHGRDGAVSINSAPTGTAGNDISFSIGLLVDGSDNTIRVGASADGTGMDTGAGTKVFDASANAFATSYSVGSTTVIDSSRNLTNIAKITGNSATGGTTTFNVGRGDVYFENNSNSNANGAGITLRTSSNPTTGSIFDVRSSGQACRFFVGQDITTAGDNPFYVGDISTGGESTASNYEILLDTNGDITAQGNITAYGTVSDIRQKENIEQIDKPIERLEKIKGITFNYKKKSKDERLMGVIAQDLLEDDILKLAVYEQEDFKAEDDDPLKHTYGVRYEHLTAILIEAVKEQQKQIDELKARLDNDSSN